MQTHAVGSAQCSAGTAPSSLGPIRPGTHELGGVLFEQATPLASSPAVEVQVSGRSMMFNVDFELQ